MTADQQVMTRWYEALLSGRYTQAKRTLQRVQPSNADEDTDQVGFCCLGVLCDLAVQDGVIGNPTMYTNPVDQDVVMDYGHPDETDHKGTAFLPDAVMEWAGLTSHNPVVEYPVEFGDPDDPYIRTAHLADLNDEEGMPFSGIAELIKANFIVKPDASIPA